MLTDVHTVFRSGQISAIIARAWTVFRVWLTRCAADDEVAERARLGRRIDGERARHARALASLSELLQGRGDAPPREATGDPLADACTLVGAAVSIAFQLPPAAVAAPRASDPLDPHRDRVLALCNASRVRSRRIALRSGCR